MENAHVGGHAVLHTISESSGLLKPQILELESAVETVPELGGCLADLGLFLKTAHRWSGVGYLSGLGGKCWCYCSNPLTMPETCFLRGFEWGYSGLGLGVPMAVPRTSCLPFCRLVGR